MQAPSRLPGMIAHHRGAEFTEGLVSRLGLRVSGFKFEIRDSKLETLIMATFAVRLGSSPSRV